MAIDMNRTTIALPGSLGLPHEDAGRLPHHRPRQRRRPEGRRFDGGLRGVYRARTGTHESSQHPKFRTKSKRRQSFFNALPSLFWCTLRDSNPGPAD